MRIVGGVRDSAAGLFRKENGCAMRLQKQEELASCCRKGKKRSTEKEGKQKGKQKAYRFALSC